MSNNDYLLARFPTLGERLPRMRLASLPTPVREVGESKKHAAPETGDAGQGEIGLPRESAAGDEG